MKIIQRSALVMHSAQRMYDLVNNVVAYPEFLPWCADTELLQAGTHALEARLDIRRGGVVASFVTSNTMEPGKTITIALKEGPFTSLSGIWRFKPLMEGACKVSLDLSFEMDNSLLKSTVGKVFEQAASTMVDAFCKRADEIYSGAA